MRIGIFGARGVAADGARRPDDAAANHETAAGVEPGPPVDVTASFPAKIRAHARRMKRFYERVRHRKDAAVFVKGALTPYTADLCLLDRCGAGFRLVRVALRRGELDRRTAFDVSPLGPAYLKALKRFLRRTGYLR